MIRPKAFNIKVFFGDSIVEYKSVISAFRFDYFDAYPYLYRGNDEYEKEYIAQYLKNKHSSLAVAFGQGDGKILGISTGIPLASNAEIISGAQKCFLSGGLVGNISSYYYIGETVVDKKHQGLGIASDLMTKQLSCIQLLGYTNSCFLTVVRDDNHLLKPMGYTETTAWNRLGFFKTNAKVNFSWPTVQPDASVKEENHELVFWTKKL